MQNSHLTLHLDVLPVVTRQAFEYLSRHGDYLKRAWYLAGGTALALQVGHRQSVDLDFFTPHKKYDEMTLERLLFASGQWSTTLREQGTIYGIIAKAKASFIAYPFFHPSRKRVRVGHIHLLVPEDIAAMKVIAISQRGRKRDFIDLYWYCQNRDPLMDVVRRAVRQYPGQEKNLHHILKSLTYFDDAEQDPMPKVFFKLSWQEVKRYFTREVPKASSQFYLA